MAYSKLDFKLDLKTIIKNILVTFLILIYWELIIYYVLHSSILGITIWNILFLLPISIVLSSLMGFHNKINNLLMIVLLFVVSLFYVTNLIYFKTFGSIFSVSMIGAGGDAITNFWWSIIETLKENIVLIILFFLPLILLVVEAFTIKKLKQSYKLFIHPIILLLGIGIWFLVVLALPLTGKQDYSAYGVYHSRFVDSDSAALKLGVLPNTLVEARYALLGSSRENLIEVEQEVVQELIPEVEYNQYQDLDFSKLANKTDDNTIKNICDYLNTVAPSNKNQYTGIFEGYNLIYICGESFSSLAIDKDITPTLYKLANGGFVLNNYYNAFKNTTTNGEYALLTGLWPDVAREETNMGKLTGTMGQSIGKCMSESIGNKFNETSIQSRAYHNYFGYYYGRNQTLPNMGFDCKFMDDGMSFTTSWPASDLEMIEQSINDYINDEKFFTYYMTFSGHGNYSDTNVMVQKNIEEAKMLAGTRVLSESAIGYYACNMELDKALEYLISKLEEKGILDKTVIVLAGDHYPYYLTDYGYETITGKPISDDMQDYHSTCIIYNSKMKRVNVDVPCCNVDILPTILNLFNIEYDSRLYAGTDIFSDNKHVAMLYNKSFITDKLRYDATNGNITKTKANMSDEELAKYIDEYNAYIKNKYIYSINVESNDFYNFVFENYHKPIKEEITIEENEIEEEYGY